MAKKKKTKTHQKIDGRLLQMNKRFSNLKQKQQQDINDWLYDEYRRIYAEIGMPPDSRHNDDILFAVNEKIEKAQIWLPFSELEKHFIGKKSSYKNRYEREIDRARLNRPIIGLIPLVDEERESYWMLPGYMQGIIDAGGTPVMLPLTDNEYIIRQLANKCSGFLLTGGHDISPLLYGEKPLPECGACSDERDRMEILLLKRIIELDKPVLGICRGIQLINAVLGGTLYQDLPTQFNSTLEHHQKPPYDKPVHDISIYRDTPLYELLNTEKISVNSYHHQAVNELSDKLLPMAKAEDGLTEAVYMPQKRFVWGIQWHPEFSYRSDENSRLIFERFVTETKNKPNNGN